MGLVLCTPGSTEVLRYPWKTIRAILDLVVCCYGPCGVPNTQPPSDSLSPPSSSFSLYRDLLARQLERASLTNQLQSHLLFSASNTTPRPKFIAQLPLVICFSNFDKETRPVRPCKHGSSPGKSAQGPGISDGTIAHTAHVFQGTEAIHVLDLKYHGIRHQTDLVVKDEEARRLKLRIVVLKDEVATLRDDLADKDHKIHTLSQQQDGIRAELERVNQTCATQESQLRLQARQYSELQVPEAAIF